MPNRNGATIANVEPNFNPGPESITLAVTETERPRSPRPFPSVGSGGTRWYRLRTYVVAAGSVMRRPAINILFLKVSEGKQSVIIAAEASVTNRPYCLKRRVLVGPIKNCIWVKQVI